MTANQMTKQIYSLDELDKQPYYHFIADYDELRWFFDHVIRPPQLCEGYVFCMSARKKKLTEEEKDIYELGRSEMIAPNVVFSSHGDFSFERWARGIQKFEVNKLAYVSKSGLTFPAKTLSIYCTPNPCSQLKAIRLLKQRIADLENMLIDSAATCSKNGVEEALDQLTRTIDKFGKLQFASIDSKYWVDFDFDIEKNYKKSVSEHIHKVFYDRFGPGNFVCISTSGGMHVLLKKELLKFNPKEICIDAMTPVKDYIQEAILNKNCMLCPPGTYQYGTPVTVFNKDDF